MTVFADAFFYVALLNPRDEFHHTVLTFAGQFRGAVVTT
jgi:hypothetical protein